MLSWASRFNICSFLANHNYAASPHFQETIVGAGVIQEIALTDTIAIEAFICQHKDWIFFHLSFEALSLLEKAETTFADPTEFSPLRFFVPQYVIQLKEDIVEIASVEEDHEQVYQQILAEAPETNSLSSPVKITPRISKETYLEKINGLLAHIHRGDCYEINFCQAFFAEQAVIDPIQTWLSLCKISPNPFSSFYKNDQAYLLSASPERFLCKEGDQLISQPMKGTIHRDLYDPINDARLKETLQQSKKDQMENVMVVDLVRNDLSRVCKQGTVRVRELFGVYAYPQVFQMISTIEGTLREKTSFMEILEACFPMGSMTGAPKHKVLELIRKFEEHPRGLFSGSIGYIDPNGDFDMNVVIRSVLYNAQTQYLWYMTGSGITAASEPEKEYEECLLKGSAIRKVLS